MELLIRNANLLALAAITSLSLTACKKPAQVDSGSQGASSVQGNGSEEFVGSVEDLMKRKNDVTCTFTRTDAAGTMNGTVFVTRDGRMSGEFSLESAQFGTIAMQVIRDGDYGYTWGYPSANQGTKVKLDATGKPVKENKKDGPTIDDPMTYACETWRVDASKFVPPSTVTFQDISEVMEQINNANAAKCSACDQVPAGQGREQCRTALGCS